SGARDVLSLEVDATHHTMVVGSLDDPEAKPAGKETWSYARPAPNHLVIDGKHHGHQLHVTLHLQLEPQLATRGFHWVNESPPNRYQP
ncbi:MAG TPA: hypothetical protein VH165_18480, partial [Kofleriaceae bacterium]|nr:hypothetical protein [Kofleriaceae bacterium]